MSDYLCNIEHVPSFYREFLEKLIDSQMRYYASDIFKELEFETASQFAEALDKVIHTLNLAKIPVEHHIRPVYAGFSHDLITDYQLSSLATGLIIMYFTPSSSTMAVEKINLVKKCFEI